MDKDATLHNIPPWRKPALDTLQAECNTLIAKIGDVAEERLIDAVNWAALKCNEAQLVIPQEGTPFWRVCIDEASPEAHQFATAIAEGLKRWGWLPYVEVTTEW